MAASGGMLRIGGLPGLPLWRPPPMVGRQVVPRFTSALGGSTFTTSPEPGKPTGPLSAREFEQRNVIAQSPDEAATLSRCQGSELVTQLPHPSVAGI